MMDIQIVKPILHLDNGNSKSTIEKHCQGNSMIKHCQGNIASKSNKNCKTANFARYSPALVIDFLGNMCLKYYSHLTMRTWVRILYSHCL